MHAHVRTVEYHFACLCVCVCVHVRVRGVCGLCARTHAAVEQDVEVLPDDPGHSEHSSAGHGVQTDDRRPPKGHEGPQRCLRTAATGGQWEEPTATG